MNAVLPQRFQAPGHHQGKADDLQKRDESRRVPHAHQARQQQGVKARLPVVVAAGDALHPLRQPVIADDARPEDQQRGAPDEQHGQHIQQPGHLFS